LARPAAVLAAAALAVTLAAADPASARRHSCKMLHSRTVVRTATTRVFVRYFSERGGLITGPVDHSEIDVYACRFDVGHRVVLDAGDGAADYPYRVAVAGDRLAMAFGSGFTGCKGDTLIKVFNVRTGRRLRCAGTTPNAAPFGVWSLVVTPRGSAAWIEQIGGAVEEPDSKDNPPDAFALRALTGRRPRTLASSRSVRRTSLRLHGHTLSWREAGTRRTAQLL
jgi:hypothetical protein